MSSVLNRIESADLPAEQLTVNHRPDLPISGLARLARDASGGLLLNVVNMVATILATIVLARAMDVAAFGVYSWVVATVTLLTVPAVLGSDRLLVREISVYLSRGADGHVAGLLHRAAQLALVTSVLIVGGVLLSYWLAGGQAQPTTVAVLAIGILALPALVYTRIAQSALLGMHQVVLGQLPDLALRPVLLLVLVSGALLVAGAPLDAPLVVLLYLTSAAGGLLVAAILLRRGLHQRLRRAQRAYETRRWALGAGALVLLSGGLVVNSQTGVVLLGVLDTPESAGLYAVAQRGALLVAFPLLALNAALAPTAARLWATRDVAQLQRLVTIGARSVLLTSLPVALVFIIAGETLLRLVFGSPFVAAGGALAILSLGQLANAATGAVATLLIMTGHQWRATLGIAAGMLVNVTLGVLLIPTLHTTGAAIAAASGLVVANVIHVLIARRALGVDATAIGRGRRNT